VGNGRYPYSFGNFEVDITTTVARFFLAQPNKTGQTYQTTIKFTQIGIFGMKIYHLATLIHNTSIVTDVF
jgi:hypothetical protein